MSHFLGQRPMLVFFLFLSSCFHHIRNETAVVDCTKVLLGVFSAVISVTWCLSSCFPFIRVVSLWSSSGSYSCTAWGVSCPTCDTSLGEVAGLWASGRGRGRWETNAALQGHVEQHTCVALCVWGGTAGSYDLLSRVCGEDETALVIRWREERTNRGKSPSIITRLLRIYVFRK